MQESRQDQLLEQILTTLESILELMSKGKTAAKDQPSAHKQGIGTGVQRKPWAHICRNPSLTSRMAELSMTNRDISRVTGISEATISRVTNGSPNPRRTTVQLICSALDTTPGEIGLCLPAMPESGAT